MGRLACCCLLLLGCVHPLTSLPVPDSRGKPLQLPAPDGGARPTLDKAGRASLLDRLLEVLGAETGDGLRKADPDADLFDPRGMTRKAFSGQGPNVLLKHLWARSGKRDKRGHPSECFWKYCV